MSKALLTLIILVVSSVALTGCFATNNQNTNATPTPIDTSMDDTEDMTIDDDDTTNDDDDMITATTTPMDDGNAMDADENQMQVTIESSSFKFAPNVIEAKPGQTITVVLDNQEG